MASVTSLDKDLKNLRLEKVTPQRANETRDWIEKALGERLSGADLLEGLKDGVALCKLVNAVVGAGTIKFKQSSMPFIQMEQISHFLRACQSPPLNLAQHDCFLTVDLFEQKDPAQVLQCIGAFSQRAAALQPSKFPSGIGGMKASTGRPQTSRAGLDSPGTRTSPTKDFTASPPGSSTWSKKADVHSTAPAWNIAQYGWTGGASQGNQGVSFGGRRQLVSSQPQLPSLAEKERRRREQEAEQADRARQTKEERQIRQARAEEEERSAAEEEARRWDEQAKLDRERIRKEAEDEKRRWEAEERKWKEEEEQRLTEEKDAQARLDRNAKPKLQGQYLSQYQAEQKTGDRTTAESNRIQELERQLAEARERERKYEEERLKRDTTGSSRPSSVVEKRASSPSKAPAPAVEDEWSQDSERGFLRQQWSRNQELPSQGRPLPVPGAQTTQSKSPRPLPIPGKKPVSTPSATEPVIAAEQLQPHRPLPVPAELKEEETPTTRRPLPDPNTAADPPKSSRPLPDPTSYTTASSVPAAEASTSSRPIPNPSTYAPSAPHLTNRTGTFLSYHPAPEPATKSSFVPPESAFSSAAEQEAEDARRNERQQNTKAGGWAAKSLIEREMEADLQRAREWEESQKATKAAAERGIADPSAGSAPGQGFNTSQYGFLGGDNQNRGAGGIYSGRRQIMGPRTMGGK